MKMIFLVPLAAILLLTGCVTRTYTTAAPPAGPSITEIQSLVEAHVSDSVIVSQIQNSSTRYHLTADQIIALKNAGASDAVINALINSAGKPQAQTTTTVQETYPSVYVDPWPFFWWGWWAPGPFYYHGYYHGGYYHHWR